MNVRSFIVLGSVMALGLSACIIESTTGGSSGDTSAGSGGSSGEGGTDPTGGTGGGGGAAPTCDETYTCTEAIDPASGDPSLVCDGPHGDLYDAYQACVCTGACATDCGTSDRCTTDGANSADCTTCIQTSCSKELTDCSNDF